jgi:3'(2'), 5'-bisphosphate nucleotidase
MLKNIIDIAIQAGSITLQYYHGDIVVDTKVDSSPVTAADLRANEFILHELALLAPNVPVVSEETPIPDYGQRKAWKEFWLVDPLDGTAEFINKLDDFTVNIALIRDGEPVLGVIFAPAKSLLYYAEKGAGAWKRRGVDNPERIFSNSPDKPGPLVVVGSRRHGTTELDEFLKAIQVQEKISIGSSLKFCLVAEGVADIYPRLGPTMEWDVAAGDCIYRNSAKIGQNQTSLRYNKTDLKNGNFVIGRVIG